MYIKIFPAIKNAGQSGRANLHHWCLRVMGDRGQRPNAVIGWSGGDDPMAEIALQFPDKETAVAAAEKIGLPYYVAVGTGMTERRVEGKNYAENFSSLRHRPWTH
ncbi:MAG: ETC complex I subunit [Hydrotalea sp.]|nr:ETC complex I subunit [Hydrotalea sp.]